MSLHLWILRHGKAEPHRSDDAGRALVERGEREARAAGQWLAKKNRVSPALQVLASPYVRAQQTARAALEALPDIALQTAPWLVPDYDPDAALREIAKLGAAELLLVSHQPLVSALVGLLVEGDYRAGPALGTASLAELELPVVAAGCGRLLSVRHAPDYARAGH